MYVRRAGAVLVFVGAMLAIMGVGLSVAIETETLVPEVWPWAFYAGAGLCWLLAATWNRTLLSITSVYVMMLFLGRVFATIDRAQSDVANDGRILVAIGVYGMCAFLVAVVMVVVIAPIVAWKSQGH
jgi:hypothetical protein